MAAERTSTAAEVDATQARLKAVARGRAYDLLGALFRDGVRTDRLPALRAVEVLAPSVPEVVDDEFEALHHRLFRVEVLAYESLFLEPDGAVGGRRTALLERQLAAAGLAGREEPDAIATQCALMCRLCGAEADAWRDGEHATARRLQAQQQAFLAAHLCAWAPAWSLALTAAVDILDCSRLFADAADLLVALAADHLGDTPIAAADDEDLDSGLLTDPKTGLRELGRFLASPARCGAWLSSAELTAMGRELDLPRGFGRREHLFENLLNAAARYGQVPQLCGRLRRCLDQRTQGHGDLPGVDAWRARLARGQHMLDEVAGAAGAAEAAAP